MFYSCGGTKDKNRTVPLGSTQLLVMHILLDCTKGYNTKDQGPLATILIENGFVYFTVGTNVLAPLQTNKFALV